VAGRVLGTVLVLGAGLLLVGCGGRPATADGDPVAPPVSGPIRSPAAVPTATAGVPPELWAGEVLFRQRCLSCHGPAGTGTDLGPPLVNALYAPDTVTDEAFTKAVLFGAKKRQWDLGDMVPVAGLTEPDVRQITAYVRYLQRQAGIQ
jgi:mono/diheme cytochrome c family protein